MGKLVVNIKVTAGESFDEKSQENLVKTLSKYGQIYKIDEQPIGFGIKRYKITLIANEDVDSDALEEELNQIKNAEARIEDITRMLEM